MKVRAGILVLFCLIGFNAQGESLRILMAGTGEVSLDGAEGVMVPLSYVSSAAIILTGDIRFFRGIQIELNAPQRWLDYQGSLASAIYAELDRIPPEGAADVNARQISFEALPGKLQNTWQIPMKPGHGLRSSPYIGVPTGVVPPESFPLLFRLMPVIKGISQELETMVFQFTVKPILSDEGAIRLSIQYPEQVGGRPVTILIDDAVVDNINEDRLLKEGEHHLVVLSDDYRGQSRRFVVERAKTIELVVELQDAAPLIYFEYPENTRIFLDNVPVSDPGTPQPVEPGLHEVRFLVSDYSVIRPVTVQKGKTYCVALSVDVNVTEKE
jgi:hypothetical protein